MGMPTRGVAALELQDDLPLLLLSAVAQPLAALLPYGCGTPLAGAALPILQKCTVIIVYRSTPQCGERSNAAISQAVCRRATVTRASRSKARLQSVPNRRDSWRSHVHRTYIAQRVQLFKLQTRNVGGRGALPSPFSGGFKGGILFGKRIPPLVPRRARRSPSRARAGKSRHPFGKGCKKDPPQLWQVFF